VAHCELRRRRAREALFLFPLGSPARIGSAGEMMHRHKSRTATASMDDLDIQFWSNPMNGKPSQQTSSIPKNTHCHDLCEIGEYVAYRLLDQFIYSHCIFRSLCGINALTSCFTS
jgi:hypothetical protein